MSTTSQKLPKSYLCLITEQREINDSAMPQAANLTKVILRTFNASQRIRFRQIRTANFSICRVASRNGGQANMFDDWAEEESIEDAALNARLRRERDERLARENNPRIPSGERGWLKDEFRPGHNSITKIEEALLDQSQKIGWVIYRTTYSDDAKWDRFVQLFQNFIRTKVAYDYDTEAHLQHVAWPIKEDRQVFNKATTTELRKHFVTWRDLDAVTAENGGAFKSDDDRIRRLSHPLYEYFIHVDEDAMESVLAQGENKLVGNGWVNVVQADWPPNDKDDLEEILTETGNPLIDGMDTWQVGFERVEAEYLYPSYFLQTAIVGGPSQYTRPPALAVF